MKFREAENPSSNKYVRNSQYLRQVPRLTFDFNREIAREGSIEVRDLLNYLNSEISVQDLKELQTGQYFGKSLFVGYQKLIKIFYKIS